MKIPFASKFFVLALLTAQAQQEGRIVTFIFPPGDPTTNTITLREGELVRLLQVNGETSADMGASFMRGAERVERGFEFSVDAVCFAGPGLVFLYGSDIFLSLEVTAPIEGLRRAVTFFVSPARTNVFEVEEGEYAECLTQPSDWQSKTTVTKNGSTWVVRWPMDETKPRLIVAGPAEIQIAPEIDMVESGCTTWRIRKQPVDPSSTQVILPGENAVGVRMESSTDLRRWALATNGIYSAGMAPLFFRLRLDR